MEEEMQFRNPSNAFKSYKFDKSNPQEFEQSRQDYNTDMDKRKRHEKLMKELEEEEAELDSYEGEDDFGEDGFGHDYPDYGGPVHRMRPNMRHGMMEDDDDIWGMKVIMSLCVCLLS